MVEIKTELTPTQKMFSTISKVVIREGVLQSDPAIWEITIDGKVLKVDSNHMLTQGAFGNQYLRAFHVPMPLIDFKDWRYLVAVLGESAEIVNTNEESERVYIARQVFEEVCSMQVGERDVSASRGKNLVEYGGCYCLASGKIEDIVAKHGYKTTTKELSTTMVELGMKEEGTEAIYFGSKRARAWHFKKVIIDEHKNHAEQLSEIEAPKIENSLPNCESTPA